MESANVARLKGEFAETSMSGHQLSPTARVARWSAIHRWWVVAASVLAVVLSMFVLSSVDTKLLEGDAGEGESKVGIDLIDERFGTDLTEDPTEQLVFSNPSLDASDPEYRSVVEGLVEQLQGLPGVKSATSYYDTNSPKMVSADGRAVLAIVVIDDGSSGTDDTVEMLLDTVRAASADAEGFEIAIAGDTSLSKQQEDLLDQDFARIMMVTLVLGLTILLIAFRAVVAAIVPLVLAVWAILGANAVAALVSQSYPLADAYGEMILLMGMAVGIDYSLFIVSRFRTERKAGRPKLEAIAVASNTTGRAVFYAGITVLLSLAGLMMTDNPVFISLALGAMIVVALAIVGSITLLPALLGILGDNVNRLRVPIIGRERPDSNGGGIWGAITDRVLARPGVLATITAATLIVVALPVMSLNLGFNSGADAIPDAIEGKRAVELLEEHFTAGLTAPAFVVVDAPDVTSSEVQTSMTTLIDRLEKDDAFFGPFEIEVNEASDLLYIRVPLVGDIDDAASEEAVRHLRQDVIPAAFRGTNTQVYITGQTAASIDFKEQMYDKAPYVFAFVLGLAFLLLLVMFRSIIIPIKAIVLNLLSVGAAYGVLVMVFQWGWGIGLLGAESTGVVEAWLPLFLFGILFGLSMDYHMLLLSRVKEAHDEGQDNEQAVSTGVKVTAGQITSAAAIMVGVFSAFALSSDIGMKQFGLGLAVAVLVDATVIRVVLLPASMKLLGEWNWYLPRWLDWLPKVGDGEKETASAVGATRHALPATEGD